MQDGPLQRYRQMVLSRELAPDTAQELVAEKLQLLANRLAQYSEPRLSALLPFGRRRRSAPEGLYLYGGVGRGKTMLLDFFFDSVHYAPIDVLYDNGVGLIACSAPELRALYVDGTGA
jgi:cell division protein ZapE